jgi:hypothetical protein
MQNVAEPKKKMPFWRRIWKRLSLAARQTPGVAVEGLESRTLMSTGPLLTGVQLTGHLTAINAVVLTFNESLNPATAENPATYAFGRPPVGKSDDSGLSLSDFLPFRETGRVTPDIARPRLIRYGKIIFSSAVYNDANHTVTLTPVAPFKAQTWFRYLRLKGIGPLAIKDLNGNALNGGLDSVARWTVHPGKVYRYLDAARDKVTFRLTGPGKIVIFRRFGKNSNPTIFVDGATSASSLTGTVTNPRFAVPAIEVAQFEGGETVSNNLMNNPSFTVDATTP